MAIENNRTSSELYHENAYTNNTFSLPETERAIKSTLENSFNYLKNLQKSYISIARFNKTEADIYFDQDGRPCISLDKDFIDVSKRKPYKLSEYYNTYVGVDTLVENPDIFLLLPIVMIDNKSVFSYKVKSALDGHTDITFTHIDSIQRFLKSFHSISVTFLKNTYMHQFTTNKYIIEKYDWKLPQSVTGIEKENAYKNIFFIMRDTFESTGSNFFVANVDDEDNIIFDKEDDLIYDFLVNHKEVEITILSPDNLIELSGTREIFNRVDNKRQSSTFILEEDQWKHYKMPIPVNNILIFKRNKVTGELTYENNKEVILHYPNIYEIMSDDVDAEVYDYKIFYFYRKMQEYLEYQNFFKYIYRYFARKLSCNYEDTIVNLLYRQCEDMRMQEYFFRIFNYDDGSYLYNHGDFFTTLKPYDFDYKTEKMREFLEKNPYSFIPYGKRVAMPFQSYHLDVRNIDLKSRIRNNTIKEAKMTYDYYYFKEPFYVFMFGNESNANLDLRFFIDGLFCDSVFQLHVKDMEYLYIPVSYVKKDSHIVIERFETYTYQKKIQFVNEETPVTLTFDAKEFIKPTLYDLFVTDQDWKMLERSRFKMYALINTKEYDVSDILGVPEDNIELMINDDVIYEDPETGEVYILLDDLFDIFTEDDDGDGVGSVELGDHDTKIPSYKDSRLPLKYMPLEKLKVFCLEPDYLNKELRFIVNKVPFLTHKQMAKKGLPKIKLFNGSIPWKQAPSFVRTFVNGRFQPMEFDIIEHNPTHTYIIPRCYLYPGDILSIDVTPYSYELEFSMKEIPDNFMVKFNGALSKPFDHAYYDVYLNGRKLEEHQVKMITPDRIQFFNVKSRKNLKIYRRDRDYEYYGFTHTPHVHLDDILNSPDVPDEDKQKIIYDVIYEDIPEEDVKPGKDIEWDNENLKVIPEGIFQKYRFYLDIVLPEGIARPNGFMINKDLVKNTYTETWNLYSNKVDRVVLRPNTGCRKAKIVLMLGKAYMEDEVPNITSNIDHLLAVFGDPTLMEHISDGTIYKALLDLFSRLGIRFKVDPITGQVEAIFDYTDDEKINNLQNTLGEDQILTNIADGTVLGAISELFRKMGGITFAFNEDKSLRADFEDDE